MSGRYLPRRLLGPLLAALLLVPSALASADPVTLTGGKNARFRAFVAPTRNNAVITISGDDAVQPVLDPIACPADPVLRLRASDGWDTGDVVLPCALWRRAGTGFKYVDRTAAIAGVQSVVYAKRRLVVKLKGVNYPALIGPLGFPPAIEVSFSSGSREYCARFTTFKRNEAGNLHAIRPSIACVAPTPTPTPSPSPTPTPTPAIACPAGTTCTAFTVLPGPNDLLPVDDGHSTWLRLFDFTGAGIFGNATDGAFGPDRIVLAKGETGPDGIAPLTLVGTTYLGASLVPIAQQLGSHGTVCVRLEQDPDATGWIACDGGRDASVGLVIDSNGAGPAEPSVLDVPQGADPGAPAGSAVVRVRLRFTMAPDDGADCAALDWAAVPEIATAFTTDVATSRVDEDWIDGQPGAAGVNETSLTGVPLSCDGFGTPDAAPASIVAPLFGLDFTAPIVNQVVDLAQVLRLDLAPAGSSAPTPTAQPSATPSPTPTSTPAPTLAPTATPSAAPTASPTPTPAPTATPTPTPTVVPTPTPMPTTTIVPAQIDTVSINDASANWGPDYTALGNCYDGARTSASVVGQGVGTFSTRFQQSVATDCEAVPTGGGGVAADASADYTISFAVTCPAGSTYQLAVATTLRGAHTINRDNGDGCDLPFFGTTLDSQARVSAVSGVATGGALVSGSLGLAAPADLTSAPDADAPFLRTGNAIVSGVGTGAPVAHTLRFTWNAHCESNGDSLNTGSECAVRLGATSALAPNGIGGCMSADDYPGVGGRNAADDGHLVDVSAVCVVPVGAPTATPQPTATPAATPTSGGATPTPTPAPTASPIVTPTPTAGPLGAMSFTVATGSSAYCPSDGVSGSFLKTQGNPTGGIPGTVCSGSKGAFTSGPLQLAAGAPDAFGRADLILTSPVVIGVDLDGQTPNCGGSCGACWRFEDDPSNLGFIDCDGGSNVDQTLIVNSNGTSAPPAPALDPSWWTFPSGGGNSGAGAAVVRVRVKRMRVNGTTTCPGPADAAWSSRPVETLALTTGTATARIDSPRRCTGTLFGTGCPNANPFTVTLSGTNFSCASWGTPSSARLVIPFVNLDENLGGSFGTGDIAQVLRLND